MKHTAYSIMLAGLLMTGCIAGDYGIKPADPQSWSQEDAVTLPSLTASAVQPIDIARVEEDSVAIAAITPMVVEGAEVRYVVVLDDIYKFPVGEDGKVAVSLLQETVTSAYGKAPRARTFDAVVNAYVMAGDGGQASLVQSGKFTLEVTPEAPFIDSAYYLIGNVNGWNADASKEFMFKHSGKDVYDDPVFSIVVTVEDASYWKIVPQGNYDAGNVWAEGPQGVLGVALDGDDSAEGKLVTEKPQAAQIPAAGTYSISINMMEYTYKVSPMASEYYLVGALNSWNTTEAGKYCLLYPEGSNVFSYTTNWTGDHNFKIWSGADYGNWDAAVGNPVDGNAAAEGTLGGGGAICTPTAGFYKVTFDMAANTYSSVALDDQAPAEHESISLIGDFNGWGGDLDLTEGAPHNWYVFGAEIPADGGLKFRAGHDWTFSWGAEADIADCNYGTATSSNGPNMTVPAGTYDIFFNDITGQFVFVSR